MKSHTIERTTKGGNNDYTTLFDRDIKELFRNTLKLSLNNPSLAIFLFKTIHRQRKASRERTKWRKAGINVPPVIIYSVTNRCNLNCKGCYANAHRREEGHEMNPVKIESVFKEAEELGISIILIAGGEPFLRKELLPIIEKFPKIIFPVFTNGLLLNDGISDRIARIKNLVPVLSIEGSERETDERRGDGIFKHFREVVPKLNRKKILWGISLTLTRDNFEVVTSEEFIKELLLTGSRLFFFVEYVPIKEETTGLVLTLEQKEKLICITRKLNSAYPGLFISLPGDESSYGGCLAAGRGFIHISADGRVEPCPFAPYSDTSLNDLTLKDALKSNLLNKIRENHKNLTEGNGGCALWTHREWVKSLLK